MGVKRPRQHWEPYYLELEGRTHKTNWIRGLLRRGLEPGIVILEHAPNRAEALLLEQSWISFLREKGAPLTNQTSGGDGSPGYSHTDEAKEKIAAAKRGKPRSPEARAKMSASHKSRERSPEELEHVRALGRAWKGKKRSQETRDRMAAAKRGKPRPPEVVARVAAALRGRKLSKDHVKKMRQAQLGKVRSPETRARMAEAERQWWAERAEQG